MTYVERAESSLSYTMNDQIINGQKVLALAAQADEQRTANLIAIMNSARIGSVKQNQIRDIILERLGVPNTELTVFDEEED